MWVCIGPTFLERLSEKESQDTVNVLSDCSMEKTSFLAKDASLYTQLWPVFPAFGRSSIEDGTRRGQQEGTQATGCAVGLRGFQLRSSCHLSSGASV